MKAIVQERFGPPDVLHLVDTDPPEVGAGGRWRACCSQHESNAVRVQEKINSAISPSARAMRIRTASAGAGA